MLDNYNFQRMSANARALLPMLWLLASEDEDPVSGRIRISYEEISFRLRLNLSDVESGIKEISQSGFIVIEQSCNESVTKPYLNRNETVLPETETETETEKKPPTPFLVLPDWMPKDLWDSWMQVRKTMKAVNSYRAQVGLIKRLEQFLNQGHDPCKLVEMAIINSWKNVYLPKEDYNGKPEGFRTKQIKAAFAASGLAEGKREPTAYEIITSQAGGNSQPISEAIPALLIGKREPN
jgi:hypothetical protein